ncbi:zinc finger, CCHC-type containing protein [Tanacetum coccineum]
MIYKILCTDRGGEYYDPVIFQFVGIIHETTAPYTPQQNGVAKRKNRALKEMVNSMLSYSGFSEGFWGEAMAVVRLSGPKRKTLGEKGIDCIFVGYAEHSKAYRFYVIEPNDSVSINSIIESRDAIFDENRFSLIPRPKDIILNSDESQRDDHSDDVPNSAFGKEAIDDAICSIIENRYWVLLILPQVESIGCSMDLKKEDECDGTIDKFKARLIIVGLSSYTQSSDPSNGYQNSILNGDLDEKGVYEAQPKGLVLVGWHQKFDEVVLSSGFHLNQSDKTDQNQVDKTKKFLLSKFLMKDIGEAGVILGIKIKRKNKGIVITQSHYTGKPVDHLEHSRAIGCLMYAMTSTRPDIAYVVGRLRRFTSNLSRQHWKAITRVFKYL